MAFPKSLTRSCHHLSSGRLDSWKTCRQWKQRPRYCHQMFERGLTPASCLTGRCLNSARNLRRSSRGGCRRQVVCRYCTSPQGRRCQAERGWFAHSRLKATGQKSRNCFVKQLSRETLSPGTVQGEAFLCSSSYPSLLPLVQTSTLRVRPGLGSSQRGRREPKRPCFRAPVTRSRLSQILREPSALVQSVATVVGVSAVQSGPFTHQR